MTRRVGFAETPRRERVRSLLDDLPDGSSELLGALVFEHGGDVGLLV